MTFSKLKKSVQKILYISKKRHSMVHYYLNDDIFLDFPTIAEIAERINLSESTLYRNLFRSNCGRVKYRNRVLFRYKDLHVFPTLFKEIRENEKE